MYIVGLSCLRFCPLTQTGISHSGFPISIVKSEIAINSSISVVSARFLSLFRSFFSILYHFDKIFAMFVSQTVNDVKVIGQRSLKPITSR